MGPTKESVQSLIDELDAARNCSEWLTATFGCRWCKAPPGTACVRPDGSPAEHPHQARIDSTVSTHRSLRAGAWRRELTEGRRPIAVLLEVRKSKLYRAAYRHGRVVDELPNRAPRGSLQEAAAAG